MIKHISLLAILSFCISVSLYAQGTFWYENFDGATTKWDNTTFFTAFPGGGPNNANANKWIINNNSSLTSPCGSSGDKSLHVTCNSGFLCTLFGPGANYDDGPFNNTQTDRITSSLNITTPATGTINIKFNWLCVGSSTDFGRAYYSTDGGITWNLITPSIFNNQSTQTTFTGTLPPSCNGISTLRIGFRWTSDDNGDGVDPSFNIDDIELYTTPPSLVINSVTTNPFCPGDPITINFTGTHTYYSPCNTFTAIMNPGAVVIGTLNLSSLTIPTTGTITGTIPIATTPGAYTITVTSSNTAASSATFPITVNSCTNSITTGTISPIAYCPNHNVIVPFTSNGTFTAGNVFTAQLSDAVGSFATPVNIGTLAMSGTNPSGNIPAGIPPATPAGTGYRIRVISSAPPVTGTDNGTDITIYPLPMTSGITPTTAVCVGDNVVYSVTATSGSTYNWVVTGGTVISGAGTNSVTINWTTPGTQTITVTETNSNGCPGTPVTVNITVNSCAVSITTGTINPLSYCAGDAISVPFTTSGTFSAGNVFTAELSNNLGSFATTTVLGTLALSGTNPSGTISGTIPLSTTSSALYRVRVISSAPVSIGTDNGANITINQKDAFGISVIYKDTVVCVGSNGIYTVKNNQDTYNWTVSGGGTILSGNGTPSITVNWTTVGNYTITMNGTTGACNNTPGIINVQVITPEPANVSISPSAVCAGQTVLLTASSTNGGSSPTYQWFINGNPVIGATASTFTTPSTLTAGDIISVQITSNGVCVTPNTATAQIVVTNGSVAGTANSNQTICPGQNAMVTLVGYSGNIQWQSSTDNVTFTNISGANNDTLLINGITQTTYYRAEVTTGSCTPNVSNVVQIIVSPKPTASFTANPNPVSLPDATVNFTNNSTNAVSYQWNFGDGNTSVISTPTHTYTTQGNYTVTLVATSLLGCTDTTRVIVTVLPEGSTMFIPNIFTPNGDGFNDVFAPVFQNYTNIKIQIFNRWGNKIFEGSDKWQPNDNVPDGVYTYIITATNRENKTDTRVGTLTLLR